MSRDKRDIGGLWLSSRAQRWRTMTCATETPARLTEAEFCRRYRISREAAFKLRHDELDPLPVMRFGRRLIYDVAAVEKWAARRAAREVKAAR